MYMCSIFGTDPSIACTVFTMTISINFQTFFQARESWRCESPQHELQRHEFENPIKVVQANRTTAHLRLLHILPVCTTRIMSCMACVAVPGITDLW